MTMKTLSLSFAAVTACLVAIGCSSGGGDPPVVDEPKPVETAPTPQPGVHPAMKKVECCQFVNGAWDCVHLVPCG
jgi:hypothetical protein